MRRDIIGSIEVHYLLLMCPQAHMLSGPSRVTFYKLEKACVGGRGKKPFVDIEKL